MIYFDSAATTLQKPRAVSAAVGRAVRTLASPGRGGHPSAIEAAEVLYECRELAAGLFHVQEPEQVVFTHNATHGLNIAVRSVVQPGGRVITSGYEHNAVVRPLQGLNARVRRANRRLFHPDSCVCAFERELERGADAVVVNHVSNVFGYVQPVERIAALCRERGVPLIVDASQSAGVVDLDAQALGARFIAMPGHKGLYGPQGTGLLLCMEPGEPLLLGGTGSASLSPRMPDFLPDRMEAGTHNAAGVAGLLEGLRFVAHRTPAAIRSREEALLRMLVGELRKISGLRLYAAPDGGCQTGVLSFTAEQRDCEALGAELGARGVAVRAGLHCAPQAHESAGTVDTGTVRVSFSAFSTAAEVRRFARILREILTVPST